MIKGVLLSSVAASALLLGAAQAAPKKPTAPPHSIAKISKVAAKDANNNVEAKREGKREFTNIGKRVGAVVLPQSGRPEAGNTGACAPL